MRAFPLFRLLPFLIVSAALIFAPAGAQELREHPTPFSVWLDFKALAAPNPPKVGLPIWLESAQIEAQKNVFGRTEKTIFRLRFRSLGELNRELFLRLFFDDIKDLGPTVTGRSASGVPLFEHGPFGSGLNLPSSETLVLSMIDVSSVEIEVRGTGDNVRGTFLTSLRKTETRQALDFAPPAELVDAFDNLPSRLPPLDDTYLYGRVRATLDAGIAKLTPREASKETWEFELTEPPLAAVLSFEVLNADPLSPLEITLNDRPLGATAIRMPDLADPGYQGVLRPLDRGVRFRYAGWLQAQKAISGSALRAGPNKLVLRLPSESGSVAIRSLELQLKNR